MPNYRRYFVPGGTYFFTLVTKDRIPLFQSEDARRMLREAIAEEKTKRPFDLAAIVLLPDHLHTIWTLPAGDAAYSLRWAKIKEIFTRKHLRAGGAEGSLPCLEFCIANDPCGNAGSGSIPVRTRTTSRVAWIMLTGTRSSMGSSRECATIPGRRFFVMWRWESTT